MKWFRALSAISMLAVSVQLLCGFESAPNLPFVTSAYSGHEEITRQALNRTLQRFQQRGVGIFSNIADVTSDLEPVSKGLMGYQSKNMIIHGNFAMDFPNQTSVMSLASLLKVSDFSYAESAKGQVYHFLRNYRNSNTVGSARAACLGAREGIKKITADAVNLWQAGDQRKALFLIGSATHTLQDSFSPAHARRGGNEEGYKIHDICFYGDRMGKMLRDPSGRSAEPCYHNSVDAGDSIWNLSSKDLQRTQREWPGEAAIQCNTTNAYPQTEEQKQNCLKSEARLARLATEKYLYLVFSHLSSNNPRPLDNFLASLDSGLFDGPVGDAELDAKMSSGIMRCDGLSEQEFSGFDPGM